MSRKSNPDWDDVLSAAARLQSKARFDQVLGQLESVAGWKTARVSRPVQILGSLDGIDTGVRQLIRSEPLETEDVEHSGVRLIVPTRNEMLRIKAVLILKRNATRDYLDFVALADSLGEEGMIAALRRFDILYPQPNGSSAIQQLQIQLADPRPYDLEVTRLPEYKHLKSRWHDWNEVGRVCAGAAAALLARDDEMEEGPSSADEQ